MKEIKFRAWDKALTQWVTEGFHVFGEFTMLGGIECYIEENRNNAETSLERIQDIEVQQFIGLKDKNGKEIYEGDIITCHTNNKFKYPHKGQVIYLEHVAGFGITTEPIVSDWTGEETEAFTYFNYNENFEVIGNICENPELIEAKL